MSLPPRRGTVKGAGASAAVRGGEIGRSRRLPLALRPRPFGGALGRNWGAATAHLHLVPLRATGWEEAAGARHRRYPAAATAREHLAGALGLLLAEADTKALQAACQQKALEASAGQFSAQLVEAKRQEVEARPGEHTEAVGAAGAGRLVHGGDGPHGQSGGGDPPSPGHARGSWRSWRMPAQLSWRPSRRWRSPPCRRLPGSPRFDYRLEGRSINPFLPGHGGRRASRRRGRGGRGRLTGPLDLDDGVADVFKQP